MVILATLSLRIRVGTETVDVQKTDSSEGAR
jgi:hypothetical protein